MIHPRDKYWERSEQHALKKEKKQLQAIKELKGVEPLFSAIAFEEMVVKMEAMEEWSIKDVHYPGLGCRCAECGGYEAIWWRAGQQW